LGLAAGGAGIPRARRAPGTVTVPLCSRPNASPFWIMLLLSLGVLEHGMIDAGRTPTHGSLISARHTSTKEATENSTLNLAEGGSVAASNQLAVISLTPIWRIASTMF